METETQTITLEERSATHTVIYLVRASILKYDGPRRWTVHVQEIEEITLWPDATKTGYIVRDADWMEHHHTLCRTLEESHWGQIIHRHEKARDAEVSA